MKFRSNILIWCILSKSQPLYTDSFASFTGLFRTTASEISWRLNILLYIPLTRDVTNFQIMSLSDRWPALCRVVLQIFSLGGVLVVPDYSKHLWSVRSGNSVSTDLKPTQCRPFLSDSLNSVFLLYLVQGGKTLAFGKLIHSVSQVCPQLLHHWHR